MADVAIKQLSKKFGDFLALSELSLDIQSGEFLTLLGPSGCGKTTLLKLISGFLDPTKGTISIGGVDVTNVPPENRDTALCFQSYALFPHMTVRENLEFGLRQKRVPKAERETRVADVAAKLGLEPQMKKLPNQLSGGQQQRVSLGRALVMRPSVILFDEPLSNLDAKLRDQVRIEIRRIQKEYGLTAIYVTHDQAEALAMSDRVVVLNQGRVEQVDTPEQLYLAPRTAFVADFIGNANVLEGRVTATTRDVATIETPIGVLAIAMPESKVPEHEIGSVVSVCWRPESAELTENGAMTGTVIARAFQGHFTDLVLETNGVQYRVQVGSASAKDGDLVRFNVPSDKVVLLEAAS